MSDEDGDPQSPEEQLLARHRQEKKELQGKILQLKKSLNKDKKKKKEMAEQIEEMEKDMKERHAKEVSELQISEKVSTLEKKLSEVSVSEESEPNQALDNVENEENYENVPNDMAPNKKISKAEKRRQKKAQEEREREARIKEAEKNNKYCARNLEAAKIKMLLKELKLVMHEIQPDGNCMYAAIAHQLGNGATVASLRSEASRYLLSNRDDFAPFITDPNTGEMLTPSAYDEYCSQVEHTPAWGGQPELRAISQALKRRIEVLQAEGTNIVFGEELPNDKRIFLTYYRHYYGLGEHYNSVATLTVDDDEQEYS